MELKWSMEEEATVEAEYQPDSFPSPPMLDNVFVFRTEPNRIQMQTADGLRDKRTRKYKPVI